MCEHLRAVEDLAAAARALTLACMMRAGAPAAPLNHAYDETACEPIPDDMMALLAALSDAPGVDRRAAHMRNVPMFATIGDI